MMKSFCMQQIYGLSRVLSLRLLFDSATSAKQRIQTSVSYIAERSHSNHKRINNFNCILSKVTNSSNSRVSQKKTYLYTRRISFPSAFARAKYVWQARQRFQPHCVVLFEHVQLYHSNLLSPTQFRRLVFSVTVI